METWNQDPLLCPCEGEGWLLGSRCPHHGTDVPHPDDPERTSWKRTWHLIAQCRKAYRAYQEQAGVPRLTFAARCKNRMGSLENVSQLEAARRFTMCARELTAEILRLREEQTKKRLQKAKKTFEGDVDRLHDLLNGGWKNTQGKLPGV